MPPSCTRETCAAVSTLEFLMSTEALSEVGVDLATEIVIESDLPRGGSDGSALSPTSESELRRRLT